MSAERKQKGHNVALYIGVTNGARLVYADADLGDTHIKDLDSKRFSVALRWGTFRRNGREQSIMISGCMNVHDA